MINKAINNNKKPQRRAVVFIQKIYVDACGFRVEAITATQDVCMEGLNKRERQF